MTKEEAIKILCTCEKKPDWKHTSGMIEEACRIISALFPPNNPLTHDELLKMEGQPVWLEDGAGHKRWGLVYCTDNEVYCYDNDEALWDSEFFQLKGDREHGLHPMGWIAYRRKPEKGEVQ